MRHIRAHQALIVEDDPLFARQLECALEHVGGAWRTEHFRAAGPALQHSESRGFYADLALVDLGLPDVSGIEVIRTLRARLPSMPILVITVMSAELSLLAAIKAGAQGYLLKDEVGELIAKNITDVLRGCYPISPSLARCLFRLAGSPQLGVGDRGIELTRRERDVLQAIARGQTYTEVATLLAVSLSTIQSHIRNLYGKLGAHSQLQAVNEARQRGWLA